jgi:O-Antigen ligase
LIALAAIVAGSFITVLDFGAFIDAELMRSVPKYGGQAMLMAGVVSYLAIIAHNRRLTFGASDWLWTALFSAPFLALFIGEFLNSPHSSITALLRFMTAAGLTLSILKAEPEEVRLMLRWFGWGTVVVSVIGVVFFVLQFDTREKVPVIDLFSTKSIVFEQNVFGIISYLALCMLWIQHRKGQRVPWLTLAVLMLANGLSYYKTTIVLGALIVLLLAFGRLALLAGVTICVALGLYFQEELLLLSQVDSNGISSGRFDLWRIGFDAWTKDVAFGVGESRITPTIARFIVRDPPFTTFHSIVMDTLVAGGAVGLTTLLVSWLAITWRLGWLVLPMAVVLAPSVFNTFYMASPNVLGVVTLLIFRFLTDSSSAQSKVRTAEAMKNGIATEPT